MDLFEKDSQKRLDALLGDSFELTSQQKNKIKLLEKELEDKKIHEEKNRKRKEITSQNTGIPYDIVDMDVIKIATILGIIKSKSILEGKTPDISPSLISMMFEKPPDTGQNPPIPIYYQCSLNTVSEKVKLEYISKHIQDKHSRFKKLCKAHMHHHLEKIKETTIIDIKDLTIASYIDACKTTMNTMIEFLEDDDDPDELIHIISVIRNSLIGPISIQQYIELIKQQILALKRLKLPIKHLSWLDSFTTMYPGFFHQKPDMTSIHQELEFRHHQLYPVLRPFDMHIVVKHCFIPTIACVDIKQFLSKCFVGSYHNNPIIYLPGCGHWAFYILKEIRNEIRLWVVDHSLIKTADELSISLMSYMVQLFKTLYKAIFGDNIYRSGFLDKYPIKPILKILIRNILEVSNKSNFRQYLSELIITKSTIIATENDLFNCQKNITYDYPTETTLNKHTLIKSLFNDTTNYTRSFLKEID